MEQGHVVTTLGVLQVGFVIKVNPVLNVSHHLQLDWDQLVGLESVGQDFRVIVVNVVHQIHYGRVFEMITQKIQRKGLVLQHASGQRC